MNSSTFRIPRTTISVAVLLLWVPAAGAQHSPPTCIAQFSSTTYPGCSQSSSASLSQPRMPQMRRDCLAARRADPATELMRERKQLPRVNATVPNNGSAAKSCGSLTPCGRSRRPQGIPTPLCSTNQPRTSPRNTLPAQSRTLLGTAHRFGAGSDHDTHCADAQSTAVGHPRAQLDPVINTEGRRRRP